MQHPNWTPATVRGFFLVPLYHGCIDFLAQHQVLLWVLTVFADLGFAVLCYRLFGRTGLYGVVVFSPLLGAGGILRMNDFVVHIPRDQPADFELSQGREAPRRIEASERSQELLDAAWNAAEQP